VKPVGAVRELEVDPRIVAASNRDLEDLVAAGAFRSDLYYRLNVITLQVPPLRDREEDIPLLAEHFVRKFAAEMGRPVRRVAPEAMALLCAYHFPGNVRELENLMERAVTLTTTETVTPAALPTFRAPAGEHPSHATTLPPGGLDLDQHLGTIEQEILTKALDRAGGNRTEAAHLLRITLRSLRYRLSKYGIDAGDSTHDEK
jgi:two-component system response regulator PilR (NtrC family)